MKKVLLLGSGTQALALAKDLHEGDYFVILLTKFRHSYADDSRYVDKFFLTEAEVGDDLYHHTVVDIIETHKIDAIIPMGDITARYVSKNKDVLEKITHIKVPAIEVFEKGYDKNSLMAYCKNKGFPQPFTLNTINLDVLKSQELPFPMLIKPNYTCGGRGMTLVNSYAELKEKYPIIKEQYGECHLQQYIKQGGHQVEVQLLIAEDGSLLASSVIKKYRWYPENGGSSCCATAVENKEIVNILHKLLNGLGWVGFADFDTIEDPDTGQLLIMELNPRVPACVRTAIEGGVPWGKIIASFYLGEQLPEINFKKGVILRHLGFETLWFLHSKNRFKTKPIWFKLFGSNIFYQDFSKKDWKPLIYGTWNNIKKQLNSSFRKSKSGTR